MSDYPTAQELREVATTLQWCAITTNTHEGPESRERYTELSQKITRVSALLEANPNYFTERNALRIVA